jgi:hypothetical protein
MLRCRQSKIRYGIGALQCSNAVKARLDMALEHSVRENMERTVSLTVEYWVFPTLPLANVFSEVSSLWGRFYHPFTAMRWR